MKKWIIFSTVFVMLCGAGFNAPAQAWPFGKKDKNKAEEHQAADSSMDKKEKIPVVERKQPAATMPAAPEQPTSVAPTVQVRSPLSDEVNSLKVEDPVESLELPPDKTFVAVDDPNNPLGITVSAQKLNQCAQLISQKKYAEAQKILVPLKDWLVDATEAHINLHKTLKNIPSAQVQSELEKQLALQFALLRDKAFFQLGMLGIGQQDYSTAIKNLSRVIQSQPRSPMGAQAYEVLQQIGFTEKIQLKDPKKDANDVGQATP